MLELDKLSIIHVRVEVIVLNNDSDGIDWGMSLVLPSIEYLLRPGKGESIVRTKEIPISIITIIEDR